MLRSVLRRYVPAVALGLVGWWLNRLTVPLLTQETPEFLFGGAAALLSFLWLGAGPGMLSVVLSLASFLARGDVVGLATAVYIVEAGAAYLLYRRYGSLVFAVAAYWLAVGWILDAVAYGGLIGLPREYIVLLFVKQFFNGILNAILAEAILRAVRAVSNTVLRTTPPPVDLQRYAFGRVVFVVMLPVLALAILYTRTAYQSHIDVAQIREHRAARGVSGAVHSFLQERQVALQRLARETEIARVLQGAPREEDLAAFLAQHPEFRSVGVTDAQGAVLAMSPPGSAESPGENNLGGQGYFQQAKTLRTAYAPVMWRETHEAGPKRKKPALLIAEPILDRERTFGGVVFAALESTVLRSLLETNRRDPGEIVTLFDQHHRVIVSLDPALAPGVSLEDFVPVNEISGDHTRSFEYFPPPDGSLESRLALNLRHSSYQQVALSGWGVLVDLPAPRLHLQMMPSAYNILFFLFVTLLLLYAAISSFTRQVSGPLLTINRAASDIASGRLPWESRLELLARSPIADIQSVAASFARMQDNLAYKDPLTGLPNRQLLLDRLNLASAQSRRSRESLAVFFLDLDSFRVIDDSLGHATGDEVLREVAARLQSCVREGDTVARLAADEFVLVIRQILHVENAAKIAQKLLDTLRAPVSLRGRDVFVTASIGIALYPGDGNDPESLIKNAESAMYRAKEQGRDAYRLYTPAMNDRALERLALESALRKALDHDELVVHFQPLVELATGAVTGVEALVRWKHPELGLLAPGRFISLAELTGLIVSMDSWVLKTACRFAKEWQDKGHVGLTVAVNLSARHLQQPDLKEQVTEILRETGLNPACLAIEITESAAIPNVESTVQTLRALRSLGVRISVDDFGTGYSSLSYLRRLPVDAVKLDQSFVRDLTSDPDDAAIAQAVIAMAHSLRLKVVAEGVENHQQLEFLRRHHCDSIQGYLFSPAVPPEELERLLEAKPALSEGVTD